MHPPFEVGPGASEPSPRPDIPISKGPSAASPAPLGRQELHARQPAAPEPPSEQGSVDRQLHARPPVPPEQAAEPGADTSRARTVADMLRQLRRPFIRNAAEDPNTQPAADPEATSPEAAPAESAVSAGGDDGNDRPPTAPDSTAELPEPERPLPPHSHFHGTKREVALMQQAVRNQVLVEADVELPGETKHLPQEVEDCRVLTEAVINKAAQVGVDVSDRLPIPVRIFADDEAFDRQVDLRGGQASGLLAFSSLRHGPMVRRDPEPIETAWRMAHTVNWTASARHYYPRYETKYGLPTNTMNLVARTGMDAVNNDFLGVTFGRLMTYRLMGDTVYGTPPDCFSNDSMILDGVMRAAAQRSGQEVARIEDTLWRGHYGGAKEDLRILHNTVGRNVMRRISTLPPSNEGVDHYRPQDVIRILTELGLKDQAVEIAREHVTGTYQHFNWGR